MDNLLSRKAIGEDNKMDVCPDCVWNLILLEYILHLNENLLHNR